MLRAGWAAALERPRTALTVFAAALAVALVVNGEERFSRVALSANTEEGLARSALAMGLEDPRYVGEAGKRLLRWNAPRCWPIQAPLKRSICRTRSGAGIQG